MKKIAIWGIVAVCILILCGTGCSQYNGMVESEQAVEQSWAQVQNVYQRRADLIPNLVNTVKGYAAHENDTYQNLTKARAGLSTAYNTADSLTRQAGINTDAEMQQFEQAQRQLNSALSLYVNAVHEAYPELKANTNFLDLQTQLEGTENRISTERERYTQAVKEYNVRIRRFPAAIFASMFGFEKKPQFQADASAQQAPTVEF
jgi:LemA protein